MKIKYDFIKTLFTERGTSRVGGFSSIKSEFEAQLQEGTMEKEDDDETIIYDAEQKEIKRKPLSQEEA